jgi:hypothetical protein
LLTRNEVSRLVIKLFRGKKEKGSNYAGICQRSAETISVLVVVVRNTSIATNVRIRPRQQRQPDVSAPIECN